MKTCAIIPCYNVGDLCVPVIEQTDKLVDKILAVDDGSTDGTAGHLASTGVAILTHERNAGKGAALITAFEHVLKHPEYGEYDAILTIDGDGQHDPKEIPGLLEAYRRAPDSVVVGPREVDRPDIKWRRRWGNILSRYFISKACGQYIPDTQSGFRVFSRELLREIASELNKTMPKMIDKDTELMSAFALERTIGYNYRLVNLKARDVDSDRYVSLLKPNVANTACTTPETRDGLLRMGVTMQFKYFDMDRQHIATFSVKPSDCGF